MTRDGGVFAFGAAPFFGSTASSPPPAGVVGLVATPAGTAYTEVDGTGAAFCFPT